MTKGILIILFATLCSAKSILAQEFTGPDTVSVNSGNLVLKALLWHPAGQRRFPTVLFGHGNYASTDTIHDPIRQASLLGPLFAARGYNYLVVFRRGVGLSKGQGLNCADLMEIAFKQKGQEGRNEIQLHQLSTVQLQDMLAGLAYLRQRTDVDTQRLAIVGHSFGGALPCWLQGRIRN